MYEYDSGYYRFAQDVLGSVSTSTVMEQSSSWKSLSSVCAPLSLNPSADDLFEEANTTPSSGMVSVSKVDPAREASSSIPWKKLNASV